MGRCTRTDISPWSPYATGRQSGGAFGDDIYFVNSSVPQRLGSSSEGNAVLTAKVCSPSSRSLTT